jgi:hypothetical protein
VAEEVVRSRREAQINFLVALLDRYFCPVFIISQRGIGKIEADLRASPVFPSEVIGGRVRILEKEDGAVLPKLEAIVSGDPILSLLRTWEHQYQAAKNRMFIDFSGLTSDWPAHIVQGAKDDGVDESFELLETLYANLRHRVDPVSFDIESFDLTTVDQSSDAARRVVHARRVLGGERLHASTILPGDLFSPLHADDPEGSVWLNLTPACYTVMNRGKTLLDPRLHLVRGVPVLVPSDSSSAESREFERQRQAGRRFVIVDFVTDNAAYKFMFDTLERKSWSSISDKRVGRLLPPYITDVQLRHGAYLTSEGLPRVRPELYKPVV